MLCHLLTLIWFKVKIFFSISYVFVVANVYTNMCKVAIKISQGSVVTQTVLGGLYILQLQISYSAHEPKIMKIGWE